MRNPIYAGDIAHKGKVYPGNHAAIIERGQWDAVQQQLADHVQGVRMGRESSAALLAVKLFDRAGEPLIPVHTSKPGPDGCRTARRRYRYYVSRSAHHGAGSAGSPALRIPAQEIERVVITQLTSLLTDPLNVMACLNIEVQPMQFDTVSRRLADLRQEITAGSKRPMRRLIDQVVVHADQLELAVRTEALTCTLELNPATETPPTFSHRATIRLTRSGHRLKLIDAHGCAAAPTPDASLTGLLIQARQWWSELAKGQVDIATLSRREEVSASWMTRVVRLAFLAPEVVDSILAGSARPDLESRALLATGAVSENWNVQGARFLPMKARVGI